MMKAQIIALSAFVTLAAGVGYAEEASHDTRQSNTGSTVSSTSEPSRERPDPFVLPRAADNSIPVRAGRILSAKELQRAGLNKDDVLPHVSVF